MFNEYILGMMKVFIVLLVVFNVVFGGFENINSDIKNKKVERSINLESQLVKISDTITIENSGVGNVKSYVFLIDGKLKNHLAFISASVSIIVLTMLF